MCLTSSGTISNHEERLQISEAGRKQIKSFVFAVTMFYFDMCQNEFQVCHKFLLITLNKMIIGCFCTGSPRKSGFDPNQNKTSHLFYLWDESCASK